MNLSCYTLVLEVTRRCNMACEHCLRGDAQNMDMTEDMVRTIISKLDSISEVTFSGGEPSLNLPLIRFFFEEAARQNKLPSSFYVVTNGKANMKELALLLFEWYPRMDEKDMCGVTISRDRFHDIDWDSKDAPLNYLSALSFYRPEDKDNSNKDENKWIIQRGRALENDIGKWSYNNNINMNLSIEVWGDNAAIELLYVSANGKISGDCDVPFELVDESAFSIDTLEDAVKASESYREATA